MMFISQKNTMKKDLRKQEEIISDIKALVASPGYIITLCMILYENFHLFFEQVDVLNTRARLSEKESAFLIALFFANNNTMYSEPENPEDLIEYKHRTDELFEELHSSYLLPFFDQLSSALEDRQKNKIPEPFRKEQKYVLGDARVIKEAITYSGTGVYDVQYLYFLKLKYKYDQDWLAVNKNFEFNEVTSIVQNINNILSRKAQQVHFFGLKENREDLIQKAKKKLKKKFDKELFLKQLCVIEFYQYRELFGPIKFDQDPSIDKSNESGWQSFYKGIIDLFVVNKSDFKGFKNVDAFFNNFSFDPNVHKSELLEVKTLESYNAINSRPIIKLAEDRYFVPISFLVSESVYESPYYWMCGDKSYQDKLSANRGKASEEMTFDLLHRVFGHNTYRDIKVISSKGEVDTDIDILCVLGNKALCVQVKSKKLTRLARQGNDAQLLTDFKGAVQDAYHQGLVCRQRIMDKTARFFDVNGSELKFADQIDEVFIMGVTSENYPSLTIQSYVLLDKNDEEPFPIFLTIFDLQLIVYYLNDPYDCLYYIRQRINLMDYVRGTEEIQYLAYHLVHKLSRLPDSDCLVLDNDLGLQIDKNYYSYIYGIQDKNPEKDRVRNSWINTEFQEVCNALKEFKHPQLTNLIFDIFDWDERTRNKMVEMIREKKQQTSIDGKNHIFSLLPSSKELAGFTYVSHSSNVPRLLCKDLEGLTTVRKYQQKAKKWIGLGSLYDSDRSKIDLVAYYDYEWYYDSVIEAAATEVLGSSHQQYMRMTNYSGQKIRRNDPCPCNSGKKYKLCCGRT